MVFKRQNDYIIHQGQGGDNMIKLGHILAFDLIHKSHDAPAPYLTMQYSEQKCAHFCSE